MKSLKTLHSLFGLILLVLGLFSGQILLQLYPQVDPGFSAAQLLVQPTTLLLLAAAAANLLLGSYLLAPSNRLRSSAVVLGSLFILIASLMISAEQFARLDASMGAELVPLAIWLLVGGAVIQYAANLEGIRLPKRSSSSSKDREAGEVKWFNVSKGFGFITRDSGDDIFVHFRAIRGEGHRTLSEGQRVEFIVSHRDKGLQAEDVVSL